MGIRPFEWLRARFRTRSPSPSDESQLRATLEWRTVQSVLQRVAVRLDLHAEVSAEAVELWGTMQELVVRVRVEPSHCLNRARFSLSVSLDGQDILPDGLSFEPAAGHVSSVTGDTRFDREVRARGERALMLSVLSPTIREIILGLGGSLQIDRRSLRWTAMRAPALLESTVRQLVALTRLLAAEHWQGQDSLLLRIRTDPQPGVRGRALQAYVRDVSEEFAQAICRDVLLIDPDPEVQLKAAFWLPEEGPDILRNLACSPEVPLAIRRRAARSLPYPDPKLLERLLCGLDVVSERESIIVLLGLVGSPDVVPRLQALIRSIWSDGALKTVVHDAVSKIRSRHANGGPGALSVIKTPSGALSEVLNPAGQVAVVRAPSNG